MWREMGKIKTSFTIDEKLWKDFSIKVLKEKGGRKVSIVLEELIKKYIDEN